MGFLSKLPCLSKFLFIFELYIGALAIGFLSLIYNVSCILFLFISLGIASLSGICQLVLFILSIALALLLLVGTFQVCKLGVSLSVHQLSQASIIIYWLLLRVTKI